MEPNLSNAVLNRRGWQVFGATVKGLSHQLKGLPNQDDIYWQTKSGRGAENLLILAVADGHGSEKYFRSDVGAHFATRVAVEVTDALLKSIDRETINSGASISNIAKQELPQKIVRRWRELVQQHLSKNPLTDPELEKLSEGQKNELKDNGHLAYGATLLAAAVTEDFILYLQLGDGNILTVAEDGDVSSPLQDDPQAFADRTPSLCSDNPLRNFRVTYRPTLDDLPALILLMTDGYRNSFDSPEGFNKVGSDILEMLRKDGISGVQGELEGWLNKTTEKGSGDDITLGAIFRFSQTSSAVESSVVEEEKAAPVIEEEKEVEIDPSLVSIVSEEVTPTVSAEAPPAAAIPSPFAASNKPGLTDPVENSAAEAPAEAVTQEPSDISSQGIEDKNVPAVVEPVSEQSIGGEFIGGESVGGESSAAVTGAAQEPLSDINPDVNQNVNPDINPETEPVHETDNPVSAKDAPSKLRFGEVNEKSADSKDTSRMAALRKYFKDKIPVKIEWKPNDKEPE